MKKRSVPVVLMVTGSGLQNRDEEILDHKPFLVIADYLAKHGIASLRYDDRSVGKPRGDAVNATAYNNMKDAVAGVEFLRKMNKFGKVGVLGHSEGGCIAFMIGAERKADFIVSLAGGGVRGDSVLVEQNRVALKQSGMPENLCNDYCNALREVYLYKIANGKIENGQAVIDSIVKETKANIPVGAQQNLLQILNSQNP
ncbi:MAG: alpha/beta hydrolase [Bacteroides sp.]|nr:alpha/beta hydrolase [Bacteroides sp.]